MKIGRHAISIFAVVALIVLVAAFLMGKFIGLKKGDGDRVNYRCFTISPRTKVFENPDGQSRTVRFIDGAEVALPVTSTEAIKDQRSGGSNATQWLGVSGPNWNGWVASDQCPLEMGHPLFKRSYFNEGFDPRTIDFGLGERNPRLTFLATGVGKDGDVGDAYVVFESSSKTVGLFPVRLGRVETIKEPFDPPLPPTVAIAFEGGGGEAVSYRSEWLFSWADERVWMSRQFQTFESSMYGETNCERIERADYGWSLIEESFIDESEEKIDIDFNVSRVIKELKWDAVNRVFRDEYIRSESVEMVVHDPKPFYSKPWDAHPLGIYAAKSHVKLIGVRLHRMEKIDDDWGTTHEAPLWHKVQDDQGRVGWIRGVEGTEPNLRCVSTEL